jgi:hypothetical protein
MRASGGHAGANSFGMVPGHDVRRSKAPPREQHTMTRDQAKRAILEEWRSWAAETKIKNPNGRDGLRFFCFLEIECKHLLAFRASGDKWQVVHSWLLRAKLVSD